MKKFLCLLTAVLTVGCFAGCTLFKNHDDDVCDKCDKKESVFFPVVQWEKTKELCVDCAEEEYTIEEFKQLCRDKASELGDLTLNDIFGGDD